MSKAKILLENGIILDAEANLNDKTVLGELVFNTAMTGYQEILTDPSYASQIVVMTYPLIGNYGIEKEFAVSKKVQVGAFILKENSETPLKDVISLSDYLLTNNILCLTNVDTRKITKIIRASGTLNCLITTEEITEKHHKLLAEYESPKNVVALSSTKDIEKFSATCEKIAHFALIDYGVKTSIARQLQEVGADVTVYPYDIPAETILKENFDAVMLSNGAGNPKDVNIDTIKNLIGKIPVFGICLGHQLAALAIGGDTYKLKFGHRGANHPVIDIKTGKVFITSQNHGYAVDENSLPKTAVVTHRNINDGTVEGFCDQSKKIICVQFHPEATPGPEDAKEIFKNWVKSVSREKSHA